MNARNFQGSLLDRISDGITARAAHLQRLDLARLGRQNEAACQFQGMIADLKSQLARKAALRIPTSFVADRLELQAAAA